MTNFETGLVNAIPFGIAAVWMILSGRSSDKSGGRVWHNALPLAWVVVAMVLTCFFIKNIWVVIPLMTLIVAWTYASKGPFWALSSEWLGASAAAAGPARINALGNLSGFFFNCMIGWIKDETGSLPAGNHAHRDGRYRRHDLRSDHWASPAAHSRGCHIKRKGSPCPIPT